MTPPVSHFTIWRLPQVLRETGDSRSSFYAKVAVGLFTKPVSIGARSVGWPAREVAALNAARIGGVSLNDIKELVVRLHAARTSDEPCL